MASSGRELSIQKDIAGRLVAFRTLRGVSQVALGAACGCAFQQIQKYEQARNRIPAARLKIIADFLDVPIGTFYDSPIMASAVRLSRRRLLAMQALAALGAQAPTKHKALCELIVAIAEGDGAEGEDV